MKRMRLFAVAVVVSAVACSSDAFSATADNVLGDYTARTFATSDTSGTINWIQKGGSFTMSLGPNQVMTGTLFLPGAGVGGTDLDVVLFGTWTLTGNTITFDMPTIDSFIRDMPWTAGKNSLSGDKTFNGLRVRVVLTK